VHVGTTVGVRGIVTTVDVADARARHYQGVALIVLSTVAWSSGGLFVRLLPFDMWTIVFWRGVFGCAFVGAYVLWRFGRGTPGIIRQMGAAGVLVTLCSTGAITLFVPAFQRTSVANAMTIYAALPFFTAAIAWIWLRERPSVRTMTASLVVIVGIVIMLGPASDGPNLGDLLAGAATAALALLTVAIRRSRHVEMLPVAALSTGLSALIALPLAQHLPDLTARDYVVAAGFGLGPMTLGLMLYVIGSAMIPATLSALIGTMEAPIGALWAWVGVGEVPATATFVGGAIVLGGVSGRLLLEQRAQGRRRSNSSIRQKRSRRAVSR
jgi:drug/metabolite transporter (DMT)-like permease